MIEYTVKVRNNGSKFWYLNGQTHREDGPAVECADGTKIWYLNGQLHREDGPAIEYASGTKSWYLNGQLHREDGPAVEYVKGTEKWYLNGQCLTAAEHKTATQQTKEMTLEQAVAHLIYYAQLVKGKTNA